MSGDETLITQDIPGHGQTRALSSILMLRLTTHHHCIPLAGKLLHHQFILQPSAIPALFSFPMDPPASAFLMPHALWAKEHGGMHSLTMHPPAPHSLPPDIPALNQLLLLILPPKRPGNHPPINVQTGFKRKRMPSLPGWCLCPLDRAFQTAKCNPRHPNSVLVHGLIAPS